jgi:hypothetical protein
MAHSSCFLHLAPDTSAERPTNQLHECYDVQDHKLYLVLTVQTLSVFYSRFYVSALTFRKLYMFCFQSNKELTLKGRLQTADLRVSKQHRANFLIKCKFVPLPATRLTVVSEYSSTHS